MSEQTKASLPRIGITVGDLNGIGPEVIIKSLDHERFINRCIPIIYGSAQTLIYHKKLLKNKNFNFHQISGAEQAQEGKINVINAWKDDVRIAIGEASPATGKAALQAIQKACADAKEGLIDAIVTGPIHKKTVQQAGLDFPGHTEYLANFFEAENHLMLLVGENIKIATVTGHIPLEKVSQEVSKKKVLKAIKCLNQSLDQDFQIKGGKIAVLGLNPHAGEEGQLGNDEAESILPAIEEANRNRIHAYGPYPADGFFGSQMYREFDAVLSIYHDQGLIPFKLMEFDKGVNYTAGLSVVRTSPDHGTGFAIAGKNKANPLSMSEAIYSALQILSARKTHQDITESPLTSRMEKRKDRDN